MEHSVFQVLASQDQDSQMALRKAVALSQHRVEKQFGSFIRQGSVIDRKQRLDLVEHEVTATIEAACAEFNVDSTAIRRSVIASYITQPATKVAMVHEARRPRLCPYHSEVVDISLAQGEPQAGFNAMAQHAWGNKHCQGDEYEGSSCKFKSEMTTQSYWDGKAEQAEQRREEREQAQQFAPVEDLAPATTLEDGFESEQIEPSAIGEGIDSWEGEGGAVDPSNMSMAASLKVADGLFEGPRDASLPCPQCHGRNFGPDGRDCQLCGGTGQDPAFQSQIVDNPYGEGMDPLLDPNSARLNQDAKPMALGPFPPNMHDPRNRLNHPPNMSHVATDVTGLGGPEPKMDKRKWTPSTVPELKVDDGRWPTKRKDVTEAIPRSNDNKLTEIGEEFTEQIDVTKNVKNIKGPDTDSWSGTDGQAKPVT